MPTMCPGQDTRYWRPTDIFEIECASCGTPVEFFKDDVKRRCPKCGAVVQNPKITLGCAAWCEHAKECLGYDPKESLGDATGEASLLDRLQDILRREVGDEDRVAEALELMDEIEALLETEPKASRRLVLAAGLLGAVTDDRSRLRSLATEAGMDDATFSDVFDLVSGRASSTVEARLLDDARRLVELRRGLREGVAPGDREFQMPAAKERADKLLANAEHAS